MSPRHSSGDADAISDGVLVALAAARHIVKNRLILRALRDGVDFDRDVALGLAVEALVSLADEHLTGADDLDAQTAAAELRHARRRPAKDDRARLRRRRAAERGVAARLRELASDESTVSGLVDDARELALAEIVAAAGAALAPRAAGLSAGERAVALRELRDDLDDLWYERSGY